MPGFAVEDTMKKLGLKKFLLALSASAVLISGCSNSLDERSDGLGSGEFGSVSINDGSARAVFADDISYAVATVTGTGIKAGSEPTSGKIDISGGKGTLSVEKIPAGKNRIVTVQAFSSSNGKLNSVVMRAICDIDSGKNKTVAVSWKSTALGNVFASLLSDGKNIASIDSSDISKINAVIPADVSAPFVNAAKIASDYASGSLKSSSEYKLSAATVDLTTKNISGYKVYVGDPSSEIQTISAETSRGTLQVAPGTWPIYALDATGAVKGFAYGTFTSGGNHTISITNDGSVKIAFDRVVVDDRIIVHAKAPYIYIWDSGTSVDKKEFTSMDKETDGWYCHTIGATSANIIFLSANNWNSKVSGDLSRTAGEWWYKDGKWYDGNPDDSVAPVISSFTFSASGIASGIVTLSAAVTDNSALKKIVFSIDGTNGKEIGTAEVSGTSATATCEWNTAFVKNGTYTLTAVAYDTANNASEAKTLSLTTKNANLPPIAVISGSSYAKIDSTKEFSAENSYDQNGGTIKSYSWNVSGGATISGGSETSKISVKMPSSAGEVTVSLSVTDDENASSETVTRTVKVREQTQTSGDFRDETIYFLMTTRFYDGDTGNNAYCWDDESCFNSITLKDPGWRGDFKGLIEKLDYIKALGFSAIWITPVVENSSGLDYHGYHASNFEKVDPRYAGIGKDPMEAYQELIDACHEKGIKVIQDIVLNHTSNFGEHGFFRVFDTSNKTPGSDGVTAFITEFSTDKTNAVFSDPLYGLSCVNKFMSNNGYSDYFNLPGSIQYETIRMGAMKEDDYDTERAYHHEKSIQWEGYTVQTGQMAGDCVDINTENHKVAEYIRNAYIKYIEMGVDAFRIDTVKHISRLTFNKEFLPYFKAAGQEMGKDFFMFGEGCVLRNEVWNDNKPPISVPFYTWKGNDDSYSWSETDPKTNEDTVYKHYNDNLDVSSQPTSENAFLKGNVYHTPDRNKSSGLDMIDFYMHHKFGSAESAYAVASEEDKYFNDATYNVTYVDSHDYGPNEGGYLYKRFSGGTQEWASNLNLIFTFRGIPCVYYGTEIEFQKGMQIEPYTNGNKVPYAQSGRAYYGDHLEGTVTATDFGEYTASGTVAETLNYELSQHIIRLNKIRRAIPALRKGQYSTDGCNGSIAFKRRYTDSDVDSFAIVTINGGATFTGLPGGTYIEVVTGKTVSIGEGGTITTDSIGRGNMRVYVNTSLFGCEVDGKIGKDGVYLK